MKEISPSLNKRLIEFYEKFNERTKKKVIEEKKVEEDNLGYVG